MSNLQNDRYYEMIEEWKQERLNIESLIFIYGN